MITQSQLQNITDQISSQLLNETLISQLRAQFAPIHFTFCLDDDVANVRPVFKGRGFNLYLVDGREHCLCLTVNLENATGVVVAEVIED